MKNITKAIVATISGTVIAILLNLIICSVCKAAGVGDTIVKDLAIDLMGTIGTLLLIYGFKILLDKLTGKEAK